MTLHPPNKPQPGSVYLCIVVQPCNCWGCGSSPAQIGDFHGSSNSACLNQPYRIDPSCTYVASHRSNLRPTFEVAERFKLKIHREGATMEEFVGTLTQPLRSPVVNQTGLTKRYDFVLDMTPYVRERQPGDPPPDRAAALMTALHEKLGLKLESKKAPIEILVIDRMEKIPTEN